MNLTPVDRPIAATAAGVDVTISDGGVLRQAETAPSSAPPPVEARPALAAAPELTVPAEPGQDEMAPEPSAGPAVSPTLSVYTGRGRAALTPREGLSGQLIDITG
jgi:hypothetical protein